MNAPVFERIEVVDTHTGGEPTRVVVAGGPDLGGGSVEERRKRFGAEHDAFRAAVVCEPRGSHVMVGALLVEPIDPTCVAGVIYFNNVGPLWMCGHGTIGVVVALAHLGRIDVGTQRLETAVGVVGVEYHGENRVTIENVPSYRFRKQVPIDVEGHGTLHGDVAWGGNWFFLCEDHGELLTLENERRLTDLSLRIRETLARDGITGADGGEIDHIELVGTTRDPANDARNFVLCPGAAYDRSPCGTGTSAKLACLAADGKLAPGEVWRQESIVGSVFEGRYRAIDPVAAFAEYLRSKKMELTTGRRHVVDAVLTVNGPFRADELAERLSDSQLSHRVSRPTVFRAVHDMVDANLLVKCARGDDGIAVFEHIDIRIVASITGTAHVNAEATLLLDPADPFRHGIRPTSRDR